MCDGIFQIQLFVLPGFGLRAYDRARRSSLVSAGAGGFGRLPQGDGCYTIVWSRMLAVVTATHIERLIRFPEGRTLDNADSNLRDKFGSLVFS